MGKAARRINSLLVLSFAAVFTVSIGLAVASGVGSLPVLHGDGRSDDHPALQALLDGKSAVLPNGHVIEPGDTIVGARSFISEPLRFSSASLQRFSCEKCTILSNGENIILVGGLDEATFFDWLCDFGRAGGRFDPGRVLEDGSV